MTEKDRKRNIQIALDKAYRLNKMINEFFEITRYHSKQIKLKKQTVDLYYMLVQLRDEFLPAFSIRNNIVSLNTRSSVKIYADPEKIARVFGNILKNTAAYSYPDTEITVSAAQEEQYIAIVFQNKVKQFLRKVFLPCSTNFTVWMKPVFPTQGAQALGWRSPEKSFFCTEALLKHTANKHAI